jgi:membrane protein DedA with SNARE-associated domain
MVMLEGMGIPVPGETALVAAAVYAGSTNEISIASVELAAAEVWASVDRGSFALWRCWYYADQMR